MMVMLFQLNAKVNELERLPEKVCEMEACIMDYLEQSTKEIQE